MRKGLTFLIVAVMIMSCIAVAYAQSSLNDTEKNTNINYPSRLGIHTQPLSDDTKDIKISKEIAIQNAKDYIGSEFFTKATSISAVKVLFTQEGMENLPESNVIMDNIPVWIVTFQGVELKSHGEIVPDKASPETIPHHEMNVVVDANTGEALEMFSYR